MFILFYLIGVIFVIIGLYILRKPGRLRERCSGEVEGTVIDYNESDDERTSADDSGMNDFMDGIKRPVSEYTVDGKTYKVVGPAYFCQIDYRQKQSPEDMGTFEVENDVLYVHRIKNHFTKEYTFNPYEKLFPVGTEVRVYYDPSNPGFSYADRILENPRFAKIFIAIGGAVILAGILGSIFGK